MRLLWQNYTKQLLERKTELSCKKVVFSSAEISLNELPAGANVPFVHSHKENEEIYGILSGNGKVAILMEKN